ncbi:MAG TPA: VanZ family protein, partial [Luteolibacter sp.]
FITWLGVLWVLSSRPFTGPQLPPVDHFDKIAHFGYFFGGSGLLGAWQFRRNPLHPNWRAIIFSSILTIAVVGGLDEYHQSFTPGRSGNDLYDWLADVLGATAGVFMLKRMHRCF